MFRKESENYGYVSKKKRKSREEKLAKVGINWYIPTNVKPLTNPYK